MTRPARLRPAPAEALGGPRTRFPATRYLGPQNRISPRATRRLTPDRAVRAVTVEAGGQPARGRQRLPNRRAHELVTFEHDGIRYTAGSGGSRMAPWRKSS
jgi:hypothetical protein